MEDNKACCASMNNLLANNNTRGFSTEKEQRGDRVLNYLVFKSVDSSDEINMVNTLKNLSPNIPVKNISLHGRIGFRYCPWCGRPQ